MSYPPIRYTGASGEVSAVLREGSAEPDLVYPNGNRVHYLATGAGTEGLFGLYRWEFAGPESGPSQHFHRTMSESFYVLEGTVTILDGREWRACGPGDFVHVPAGGLHGFRNEHGPAAMLLHFAPGAPREAYFEGLVEQAAGHPLTGDAYDAFMREHDNLWVE
jgi:mannose-6-phosphate isomerase-like protein (cupin superfamily)